MDTNKDGKIIHCPDFRHRNVNMLKYREYRNYINKISLSIKYQKNIIFLPKYHEYYRYYRDIINKMSFLIKIIML